MRPVINLKRLNKWVSTEHFKMEGIPTLKDILQSEDWFVKVDLKDAYFAIIIDSGHQQYLSEVHAGGGEVPVHMPPF